MMESGTIRVWNEDGIKGPTAILCINLELIKLEIFI